MKWIVLAGLAPFLWLMAMLRPGLVPETAEITSQAVAEAIEEGAKFLKLQQQADGTWRNKPGYGGGLTPLCTLALLHSGAGIDDEAVNKSLVHLRTVKPESTYATSLQTMVFCAAEPKRDRNLILLNVKWLESRQHKEGKLSGMWAVPEHGTSDHTDNSMTHLAMLALYEAERQGIPVNAKTWRLALDYWSRAQNPDGSWGWGPGYPGTGSMTCAGIAAVIIAGGQLKAPEALVDGDQVTCCGPQRSNQHVERALGWLERNFSVTRNPGMKFWLYYYLYSLERAGRMTASRFIGQHDWYREAATVLVKTQLLTGAWPSDLDEEYVGDPSVSTSFALMFLAKARRPILLARLKYGPHDDWNHHRSAPFNLVSYIEKAWQRDLAYQVVDVERASVEDLLASPVLYISGRDALNFTDETTPKLRAYIDRGGFIFAEQCCAGDFDHSFRKWIAELFPEPEAKLQLLPPNHPVWNAQELVAPEYLRELWGVERGCRTSVVYCPQDLSCYWELARAGRDTTYSTAVQDQIKAAQSIGINVLAYATNREVQFKDPAAPIATAPADDSTPQRNRLSVASILHPGGCNAAPQALKNLLRLAADRHKIRTQTEPPQLRLTNSKLFQYHLVTMHGRTSFRLTPAERRQLKTYLERGGLLFADAICSSKEFSESFIAEMKAIFPDRALERIPPTDALFTDNFGGDAIPTTSRRQAARGEDGNAPRDAIHTGEPYLEGLRLGDRYAVIFSPFDISCALEGHAGLACEGYQREDAARIALNVLLYSFHQ